MYDPPYEERGGERVFTEPEQILAESIAMNRDVYHDQEINPEAVIAQREQRKQEKIDKKNKVEKSVSDDDVEDEVTVSDPSQLSRKETEEMDKEKKKAAFWKAQAEGKTDQAKSDLARLTIIRKQREEAARRRTEDQETKASSQREDSINAGKAIISKTLGK